MDGYVFVNIPFYVFDNASMSSIQPVKVLVPFTLLLPVRWLDFTAKAKDKNWLNSTGPQLRKRPHSTTMWNAPAMDRHSPK